MFSQFFVTQWFIALESSCTLVPIAPAVTNPPALPLLSWRASRKSLGSRMTDTSLFMNNCFLLLLVTKIRVVMSYVTQLYNTKQMKQTRLTITGLLDNFCYKQTSKIKVLDMSRESLRRLGVACMLQNLLETSKKTGCINGDMHMALYSLSSPATLAMYKQDLIHKSGRGVKVVLFWASQPNHLCLAIVKVNFYYVAT